MSDVTTDLMNGSMIAEIRARGCTTPGVAETIVEFHGPAHVSRNLHRVEELGSEVANSDTEAGAKMRALLAGQPVPAVATVDAQIAAAEETLNEKAQEVAAEQHAPVVEIPTDNAPSTADLGAVAAEQKAAVDTEVPTETLGDA